MARPREIPPELTFVNWLEELVTLPKSMTEQTIAVVKDQYDRLFAINLFAGTPINVDQNDILLALSEGPEAVADIKGIYTNVSFVDLLKDPKRTLKKLNESSLSQVFDMEEVASDRRAYYIDLLSKGKIVDKDGHPLDKPDAFLLNMFPKWIFPFTEGMPINPTTKKSTIQLLIDTKAGTTDPVDYEDRRVAEEGDPKDRYKQHKSYSSLAQGLKTLASESERHDSRIRAYNEALSAYNMTVLEELGIDLNKVLPTDTAAKTTAKGSLMSTIQELAPPDKKGDRYGDVGMILNNPTQRATLINKALGLGTNGTKKYEDYPSYIQQFLDKQLIAMELQLRFSSSIGFQLTSSDILKNLKKNGLNGVITGRNYEKLPYMARMVLPNDIATEYYKHNLELWGHIEAFMPEIKAAISENLQKEALAKAHADPLWVSGNAATQASVVKKYEDEAKEKLDRSLDRIEAAQNSINIANGLFFSSTFAEFLQSVAEGNALKEAIVASKLLSTIPFTNRNLRSLQSYSRIFTPSELPGIRTVNKIINKKVIPRLGISFESGENELIGMQKLLPNFIKDGRVSISWDENWRTRAIPVTGGVKKPSFTGMAIVKAKDAQGIFGDWSVYDVLNRIETYNLKSEYALGSLLSAEDYLTRINKGEDLDKLFSGLIDFGEQLEKLAGNEAAIKAFLLSNDADVFKNLAEKLGLFNIITDQSTGQVIRFVLPGDKLEKLKSQYQKFEKHGRNFFLKILPSKGFHNEKDRWMLLQRIVREGKMSQFLKIYTGPLNYYNRLVNHYRNFLYNNIIFGEFLEHKLSKIPIIGRPLAGVTRFILRPIRSIIKRIGLSDQIGLERAISRWKIMRKFKALSGALNSIARRSTHPGALKYFSKTPFLKAIIVKLANTRLGQYVLKSLAFLIKGAAGILTGGIGFVLTMFSGAITRFAINILKFRPKQAIKEFTIEIVKMANALRKVILYPLLFGCPCCCSCFIFIIIIPFIAASTLVDVDKLGDISYSSVVVSSNLKVTKTYAIDTANKKLEYTVTLSNIGGTPLSIDSFSDTLIYTPSCDAGKTSSYGTPGFPGVLDGISTIDEFESRFLGKTLNSGEKITESFTIKNIEATDDGTYVNMVESTASQDPGKKAIDSVSTVIGNGGCVECPSGWPVASFIVKQGPFAPFSHSGAEAVDFASALGNTVSATHSGTAFISYSTCPDDVHTKECGFGNFVTVVSDNGQFKTIYAHLSAISVSNQEHVTKGTVLGAVGSTGYSKGAHLHYEMVGGYECIDGYPLKLINIAGYGESYVPITIPRYCNDSASCNISQ